MRRFRTSLFCVLLFGAAVFGAAGAGRAGAAERPAIRVGTAPPSFVLKDLSGTERRFPDAAGVPTVIHFWSTTCNFCLEEMPAIDALYRSYRSRGLKILAVNVGDSREAARAFGAKTGVSYQVLLDTDRSVAGRYGISGLPATFFVDRRGQIKHKVLGAADSATLARYMGNLF